MFASKFSGTKYLEVWHCLLWLFEHKQYAGISVAVLEYFLKLLMAHSTEDERHKYQIELEMIGLDLEHIDWSHAISSLVTAKPVNDKYRNFNLAWYLCQNLPKCIDSVREFSTWDAKLIEVFDTSNPISIVLKVTDRIKSIASHPAPSKADHEKMSAFLKDANMTDHKLILKNAFEIYGFKWMELAYEGILSKMKKTNNVSTEMICTWLTDAYIYWKKWSEDIIFCLRT